MNTTIKITTHTVGCHFGTVATVHLGRRRISGEMTPYGFTSAAQRSALYAARGVLTLAQFAEAEGAYGL